MYVWIVSSRRRTCQIALNLIYDNSATSAVGASDLTIGRRLVPLRAFDLVGILWNPNYFKVATRGIQIDPPTRTGWTYGPLNAQVEEFHY